MLDTIVIQGLKRDWIWPAADTKCRKVIFDWAADLAEAYKHCKGFLCAVQAGGNLGVWPWLMAKKFGEVITFEPDPICFPLMVKNVGHIENIEMHRTALGAERGTCAMHYFEPNNLGAQCVTGGDEIDVVTIDSLMLQVCDLIYLDIEGSELNALRGAQHTIASHHPVIVVEDKGLSVRYGSAQGDIESWLAEEFGYRVVARPHRDVVLACA